MDDTFPSVEKKNSSCRSVGRKWKQPEEDQVSAKVPSCSRRTRPQPPSDKEITELLQRIWDSGAQCALFSVLPDFQEKKAVPPQPINVENNQCAEMKFGDLLNYCEEAFKTISWTQRQGHQLEMSTRRKSQDDLWNQHRAGRITASIMKEVCRAQTTGYCVPTIKKVCYPTDERVHADESVLLQFVNEMSITHDDFKLENCGFFVNPAYPHLGASPDAISKCSCHGKGVVTLRSTSVGKTETTGLVNIHLNRRHDFMYQLQGQMLVCGINKAHFIEQLPDGNIFMTKVLPDAELQSLLVSQSTDFYKKCVLPELVCRYFTKPQCHQLSVDIPDHSSDQMICYCKQPAVQPLIVCDNPLCKTKTFHKKCLGLVRNLKRWLCNDCRAFYNSSSDHSYPAR